MAAASETSHRQLTFLAHQVITHLRFDAKACQATGRVGGAASRLTEVFTNLLIGGGGQQRASQVVNRATALHRGAQRLAKTLTTYTGTCEGLSL